MAKPVAVIAGLDGMPLGLLVELMERGVMPWLHSAWKRFAAAETEVYVPYTPPSWATISTGVNPGKHGVFDAFTPTPEGGVRLVTKMDLERPYVNEMAAAGGVESVCVGVLYCYPPFVRTRNTVVSSWADPRLSTWPPDLRPTVVRILREGWEPRKPASLEEYVDRTLEGLERRAALVEELYRRRSWRLFYFMLPEPDWLFHYLYGDIVEGTRLGRRAYKVFERIDRMLRLLYEEMPEPGLFLLVSDHGFMEARRALNGNVLLKKLGLLVEEERRVSLRSRLVMEVARRLPPWLKSRLKYSRAAMLARRLGAAEAFETSRLPIDYSRSKAFFMSAYSLFVNRSLPREERERIAETVLRELGRYREMFRVLKRGRDYFWGPYVDRAPDVVTVPREGYNVTTRLIYRSIVEDGRWFVHSPRGMLALSTVGGDSAPRLPTGRLPATTDVAPTVLAWLGLPLDPVFDGEPLLEPRPETGLRRYGVLARIGKAVAKRG